MAEAVDGMLTVRCVRVAKNRNSPRLGDLANEVADGVTPFDLAEHDDYYDGRYVALLQRAARRGLPLREQPVAALPPSESPLIAVAVRFINRLVVDQSVALSEAPALSKFLVNHPAVEEVFGDDAELAASLRAATQQGAA